MAYGPRSWSGQVLVHVNSGNGGEEVAVIDYVAHGVDREMVLHGEDAIVV
jgi:hypothetical protein